MMWKKDKENGGLMEKWNDELLQPHPSSSQ